MTIEYEVMIVAMVGDENGDWTSWEGAGSVGQWDHFDVLVIKRNTATGENDPIEEHEELREDEAWTVFERLCERYPNADHTVAY